MNAARALDADEVAKAGTAGRSPFRPGPIVDVGYTGFARADRYSSETLYGPSVDEAVRTILTRLQLAPTAVRARNAKDGRVAVLAIMADDAPLEPGTVQAVAYLTGLSKDDLCIGLAQLAKAAWQPGPPRLSFVAGEPAA